MALPALNLVGSGRVHAKSTGNGSTPSRSDRIRPGPTVVATKGPSCSICNATAACPCPRLHEDDARPARSQHSRSYESNFSVAWKLIVLL
ncbi:hypothetical protein ZWY2020_021385 [Hordeum vulgare]|nr:hypothetical protein ZWY2020_021385 [Hordeum vulgare]